MRRFNSRFYFLPKSDRRYGRPNVRSGIGRHRTVPSLRSRHSIGIDNETTFPPFLFVLSAIMSFIQQAIIVDGPFTRINWLNESELESCRTRSERTYGIPPMGIFISKWSLFRNQSFVQSTKFCPSSRVIRIIFLWLGEGSQKSVVQEFVISPVRPVQSLIMCQISSCASLGAHVRVCCSLTRDAFRNRSVHSWNWI